MKCRLIREVERPARTPEEELAAEQTGRFPIMPVGTEIDHADAYLLVQMGVAVPADEECELAAKMTPEKMRAAQYAYERTSRGIHPGDFEAYDAGLMVGYDEQGKWIPGPNYVPEDVDNQEEGPHE